MPGTRDDGGVFEEEPRRPCQQVIDLTPVVASSVEEGRQDCACSDLAFENTVALEGRALVEPLPWQPYRLDTYPCGRQRHVL